MNLFICHTIFQLYFTMQIVKHLEIGDFDVIFIGEVNNKKTLNYFNKISKLAKTSIALDCNKKTIFFSFDIRKKISKNKYHTIYISSIDSIYTQLIISYLKFTNLYTFDDGSANINPKSSYYIENRSNKKNLVYWLMGNRFSLSRIKSISKTHYTIYKEKNIIENTSYINIFPSSSYINSNSETCNLILGSVYSEVLLSPKLKNTLFNNLKSFTNSLSDQTYYLPHPRDLASIEQYHNEYLSSELIFEDIYSQLSQKYRKINIISFCSSSILNLKLESSYIITGDIFNSSYLNLVDYISSSSTKLITINK
ncbi:hypothetical protein IMQ36_20725 [Providencia rettgeri]|nr:hypothetical protein IMQ36_20725 [Providencia rettgeri]